MVTGLQSGLSGRIFRIRMGIGVGHQKSGGGAYGSNWNCMGDLRSEKQIENFVCPILVACKLLAASSWRPSGIP